MCMLRQRCPMSMLHRTSCNCNFSQVLWNMFRQHPDKSNCGWMKASLPTTNVLFHRINQLLNDTTG